MNETTSITLIDYQKFYNDERLKFLSSTDWERKACTFLRELKQNVMDNDTEQFKKYLRSKRDEELKKFEGSWMSAIWNKCFDIRSQKFDVADFLKKLTIIDNGQINKDDLTTFFIYHCTTEAIDGLLREVIQRESYNHTTSINMNNIVVINGDFIINNDIRDSYQSTVQHEHFDNIIFEKNLFYCDEYISKLRYSILPFINLGVDNGKLTNISENQVDPTNLNEWYYIYIAILESDIVSHSQFKDNTFVDQMISWYPWLFKFDSVEEMLTFKRRFATFISKERSKWRYGAKRNVTPIKDMWKRQRSLKFDTTYLSRLYSVANDLKHSLEQVKFEVLKNQNSRAKVSPSAKSTPNTEIFIDEIRENELTETNQIVLLEIDGKPISIYLLYKHIERIFGGQFEYKYDWVAVWQWMKSHSILKKGYRTYDAFAQHWGQKEWHIEGADVCRTQDMRYYAVVDDYPIEDWKNIKGGQRTTSNGFKRLEKIVSALNNDFVIGQILK